MFTTISTYYTLPKIIEQIRQNMTGHVTNRYQGLNSSEVGANIGNLGTRLVALLQMIYRNLLRMFSWKVRNAIAKISSQGGPEN
jgi:hypothetical protein